MKINVNDKVRARLTLRGLALLEQCYLGKTQLALTSIKDGAWEGPLWELMEIFGPALHMGMSERELPFQGNVVEIVEPTESSRLAAPIELQAASGG